MFLVLIEFIDDGQREWDVCPHGSEGLRTAFATREEAEEFAKSRSQFRVNNFAVAELTLLEK